MERDKSLSEILENSKEKIQYSETKAQYNINENKHSAQLSFSKQAFVFDRETDTIKELDFIKNATELTELVLERKNPNEISQYQLELEKLKSFLYDKMNQYPEIAKEITNYLNIVSKEFNTVNTLSEKQNHSQRQEKSDVQLNVNDPDLYEDAHRMREENEEQEEEIQKARGFRR